MICPAQEAIISGFFKQSTPALPVIEESPDKQRAEEPKAGSDAEPPVRMDAILSTAMEVANGMSYLHARSIVHGDLTGSNVLLQECLVRPSRLLACVCICGLTEGLASFPGIIMTLNDLEQPAKQNSRGFVRCKCSCGWADAGDAPRLHSKGGGLWAVAGDAEHGDRDAHLRDHHPHAARAAVG